MKISVPESVNSILIKFLENGSEIYIVGGAVRDLLLGRIVTDWDFTTNARPESVVQLFEETFYDNEFGTVGIVIETDKLKLENGEIFKLPIYEVTTFRSDHGYTDRRRPDRVEWGESLNKDLQRRDFTISAMALKPTNLEEEEYELIDLNNGQKDLEQKVVRTVGNPNARFNEDALRMMRAIRFGAQLGFAIEQETMTAISDLKQLLEHVSAERIRDELLKILVSDFADEGIRLLYSTGLLDYIIPELKNSRGVMQSGHHSDDVWTHAIKSLASCPSRDPIVRLATLIHDIGKPVSRSYVCPNCSQFFRLETETNELEPRVTCPKCGNESTYREAVVFHNHEVIGARIVGKIARQLRLSNKDTDRIITLVRWHMFSVDERQTEKAIRRFIKNVGKDNLDDMLALRIGDRLGGGARETSWRLERFKQLLIEVQKQPFSIRDLKISGIEVMEILGISPGPRVGEILEKLFEEVENHTLENNPSALSERVLQIKDGVVI